MVVRARFLVLLALAATAAWAETADQAGGGSPPDTQPGPSLFTEQVVVSANLTAADRADVGSSVTVIGPAEIAARNKTSVLELLRTVAGLATVAAGGPGRASSVFIRGANSSHTLVLIDGVRVNSAGTGEYDFADLQVDQIERIEVVRGPQSSLYGSEAIGGVINIVTRRGAPGRRFQAGVEAGENGARRVRAGAEGGSDAFDYNVGVADDREPGWSLASAARGDERLNPYRNTTAAALAGARLGETGRVEFTVRGFDATVHPDGFEFGVGPTPDPNFTQQRTGVVSGLRFDLPTTRRWRQTLRVGGAFDRLRGTDPDSVFNNFRIRSDMTDAAWQSDFTFSQRERLTVGASYERRRGEVEGGYNQTAAISSVFLEDQWSWRGRLDLTGALRRDEHTVFGGATTYRATAVLHLPGGRTRLHGSWGTGFKAPTFVDLFYPFFGNVGLRPESSRGVDAGVGAVLAAGRLVTDVTVFENDIRDLISFDFATQRAENIDRARTRGLEWTLTGRIGPRLQVSGNYTYTDAEDRLTGQPLPRRPRHAGSVTLASVWSPRFSGLLAVVVERDRVESDGQGLDNVVRVDASIRRRLGAGLSATARVENLLGRRFEEVRGYRSPGRVVALGLAAEF